MAHVVLLGDSIFDNARYVPGRPPVEEQLRRHLPAGWRVTLLAVDGHVTTDVAGQLAGLPADASHLVVSVGGNDALGYSSVLAAAAGSVSAALGLLADIQDEFKRDYRGMLRAVLAVGKPAAVCTIYDAIPTLPRQAVTALTLFNDIIVREAVKEALPLVDLRLVCTAADDYSSVSPIEPSALGGHKIARAVARLVIEHDFTRGVPAVYT
jgi:hypothetical protein